ncbi:MAG: FecR domain-containing protein [Phycisphaeraceae bacterium]|nr:FecR domain-containing protein [Phycisphaeraceae bacterium]
MADRPTPDDALRRLEWVQRFYDESLSNDELARFNAMIHESPELRRVFVDYSKHCAVMFEALGVASLQQAPLDDVDQVIEPGKDDQCVVTLATEVEHDRPLTMREITSAASYLARHALLRKPVILGGIAAMLALAVTLFFVFQGGSPTLLPTQPIAGAPERPDPGAPNPARAVATLTAEHDARWAWAELTVGDTLNAGQRLTLAAGFAEVTTLSGAVAILEAPATIELLDNHNAIRLHAGKLLGSCRSDSSKGFSVHTPNALVVDIGTEFGVEVDEQRQTFAHVYVGEVEVSSLEGNGADTVRLVTGQTAVVRIDNVTAIVDSAPRRFVRGVPLSNYQAMVLAGRPMCYWRGPIEDTTRLVIDHGWLGAHGQASESLKSDAMGFVPEDASGSLHYVDPGSPASVTVPYREAFELTKDYTISLWCWIEPSHQDVMRIVSTRVESGGIGLGVNGRGDRASGGMPASAPILSIFQEHDIIATRAMPTNRWSHLVVTVDGSRNTRMFIDGEETQVKIMPGGGAIERDDKTDNQPLMIGRNPYTERGVQAWEGRLDELAIYNRVLSPEEIKQHFDAIHSP